MLWTAKFASKKIIKRHNAPSSRKKKGPHLPAFATPTLNSCQLATREGTTNHVKKVFFPEIVSIAASQLNRRRIPCMFQAARRNHHKLIRVQKSGRSVRCIYSGIAEHVVVHKKVKSSAAAPGDTTFFVQNDSTVPQWAFVPPSSVLFGEVCQLQP